MSRAMQIRLNVEALLRDFQSGQWAKMRFHWSGFCRAVGWRELHPDVKVAAIVMVTLAIIETVDLYLIDLM